VSRTVDPEKVKLMPSSQESHHQISGSRDKEAGGRLVHGMHRSHHRDQCAVGSFLEQKNGVCPTWAS
jgi:hypothetical protein